MSERTSVNATATSAHQCMVTSTDAEFTTIAGGFVRQGVAAGEQVLCTLHPSSAELLREELGADAEQITFADSQRWFGTPGRAFAGYHRYLDRQLGRVQAVRMLGELGMGSSSDHQAREWLRYEAALNGDFAERPVQVLCRYDTRNVAPDRIAQVLRTHPGLRTRDSTVPNPDYTEPHVIAADLDREPFTEPTEAITWRPLIAAELPRLRRFVRNYARFLGASQARADDASLAVNEVVENALVHGGGGHCRVWHEGATLVAEVINSRNSIDQPLAGYHRPDFLAHSGAGLWLARQLSDHIDTRGGTIRLHVKTT
jgi:anti-sigma regulatory factor (Ser/Thr protein kinase)